ncbi:MAG: hypothetical protein HGA78_01910, partial [Nitrospirales bacterium]|nr:hypothetical protein [Nitrospirales bacterium]
MAGYFVEGHLQKPMEVKTVALDGREVWIVAVGVRIDYEGKAAGLILSKIGMAGSIGAASAGVGGYDPFAATQIRILAGIVGFGMVVVATGWWPRIKAATK